MSLCVVTGASGSIGPAVVDAFIRAGYRVRAVSHRSRASFPPGVEQVTADICERDEVAKVLEDADTVVHLAALLHINDPSPSMRASYERINVQGTENVVRGVQLGTRVIYMSTIAVYGGVAAAGVPITEETEPQPDTMYAKTKLQGERVVVETGGVALRLAAVYGPHVKGNYSRLVKAIDRRRFVPVGRGKNRRTLVYEKDVAQAVLLAARDRGRRGEIFNVTDGTVHQVKDIVREIARALGKPQPRFSLPAGPVRFAVSALEHGAALIGARTPVTSATLDKYFEDVIVSGQKAVDVLGFRPGYDLAQGWKDAVAVMRQMGVL